MLDKISTDINELKRRRKFLIFVSSLGFVTLLIFTFFDYQEGNRNEIVLNIIMCTVILLGVLCVFKYHLDRIAYCIGFNLINLTLLYDVSIGAGGGGGLFWLPVMPLFLFYFLERIEAIVSTILFFCGAVILLTIPSFLGTFYYEPNVGVRYILSLFFINTFAYGLETSRSLFNRHLKQANEELKSHKADLEAALSEVKTLTGLLPICSNCKKVRDDTGYWNQIETYIKQHSEAEFTHSMCPECSDNFYGDQEWYIKMKKKKAKIGN